MTATLSTTTWTAVFFPSGFRDTVLKACTQVSFCISMPKKQSMAYSKNSHTTPVVMEKQKATKATKAGERRTLNLSERLRMSTMATPMAAIRKPFMVWSMVSQKGKMR